MKRGVSLAKRVTAEAVGTSMLPAAVAGSGIMGERLAVAVYITAAYWFNSSTSFANPAVTPARSASDTFAGIRPADVPGFILAQLLGAAAASLLFRRPIPSLPAAAEVVVPCGTGEGERHEGAFSD